MTNRVVKRFVMEMGFKFNKDQIQTIKETAFDHLVDNVFGDYDFQYDELAQIEEDSYKRFIDDIDYHDNFTTSVLQSPKKSQYIYRVLLLNDIGTINDQELGMHWVLNKDLFWNVDWLLSIRMHSISGTDPIVSNLYVLHGEVKAQAIDIFQSIIQRIEFPYESEITLTSKNINTSMFNSLYVSRRDDMKNATDSTKNILKRFI
jgi:hypothetical protein